MKNFICSFFILSFVLMQLSGCGHNLKNKDNKEDIGGGFFKDSTRIYVKGEHGFFNPIDADYSTFEYLGSLFGKDKEKVFSSFIIIKGADPDSFKVLNDSYYAKDKNRAYYFDHPIPGVDLTSFRALNKNYAADKDRIYHYYQTRNHIVRNADVSTFSVFSKNSEYAKDKKNVYYEGNSVKGADVNSFKIIGHFYGADKNSIYCMRKKTDFDIKTFALTASETYGTDKHGVYLLGNYNGKKSTALIKGADKDTFREIFIHQEINYAMDKNHVYKDSKVIPGADPGTFKIYKNNFFYAKDRNHVYCEGKILGKADPANFEPDNPEMN